MGFAWDGRVRIVGHRGSPRDAVENTLPSFEAARAAGVEAVELDVHLSADGVPMVHHDPELGRVVAGAGELAAHSADALVALGVPRLADVLAGFPGLVDVELKPDGRDAERLPEVVAGVVEREGALDRVLATSFDPYLAAAYAERAKRPAGFVTFFPVTPEDMADFPTVRHVLLAQEACEPDVVAALARAGLVVGAWTVNDEVAMRRLLAMGVTQVVTDRPGALLRALRQGETAP